MSHDLIEFVQDTRLDQSEVLRFTIPATSRKAYLLGPDRLIRWRDRHYYIAEIEENRQGSTATTSVEADALWYRLGDSVYVGSLVLTGLTPKQGVTAILEGTDWNLDAVPSTPSTSTYSLELQDKSRLEILRAWAKVTGTFLRFDTLNKTVSLLAERGADRGLAFRYGRNVRGVRRRIQPPAVTVLYPYGRDGLSIAGVNGGDPFLEDFTFYTAQGISEDDARALYTRTRVWSDSSFVEDTALLDAAQVKIDLLAQAVITYELDVVDLSGITNLDEDLAVGDTVRVTDPLFATDLRAIVVRYERHPNDPKRNRVELAYIFRPVNDATSTPGRASTANDWILFMGPISADYQIRNDGDYTVARIPLRFSTGGEAHYHLDLRAVGVGGDGSLHVEVLDNETGAVVFHPRDVRYTDGDETQVLMQWATDELEGFHDYRVRVTTTADGGPSGTMGVDIAADDDDPHEASWWIKARNAVRETPTAENSVRYDFTGAPQTFTVPDGITEITIEAHGGRGGAPNVNGLGGGGGMVTASFSVIPGTVYDVIVGDEGEGSNSSPSVAYPNGGPGGDVGSSSGSGGGGSTDVRPTGTTLASALIVAAGGGGQGEGPGANPGGGGGFFVGENGRTHNVGGSQSDGADQFAGGSGGGAGGDGSFNQGGNGEGSGTPFDYGGGGGGGGWYGGEGGRMGNHASVGDGIEAVGGAGGSGWVNADGYDIAIADGENDEDGYVIISWDDPATT